MYDHSSGKYQRDDLKNQPAAKEAERRGGDRHLVIASAEVVELSSGARFATRTTDVGPGGCFVDTLTPFPVGSQVSVTVYRGNSRFETRGVVVYSQSGLGMGVAFDKLEPGQREALDKWLAEITGARMTPVPEVRWPSAELRANTSTSDRAALIRLVQLMMSKGVLSETEAKSIFSEPLF